MRNIPWDVSAAILLLALPWLIFLKHHAYPLLNPETLLNFGLLCALGLFLGLLAVLGRTPGRWVIMVSLTVLVVDVQTEWITTWGFRLLVNLLLIGTFFWLLRKRLSPFVVVGPGVPAGYDRRQLPIDHIFKSYLALGLDPGDPNLEKSPWVWLKDENGPMVQVEMPFFEEGIPLREAAGGP